MVSWKSHVCCVIDVETTGTEIGYHEIAQLCILPVDTNFDVRKDVNPLYLHIRPEHPKRVDPQAMKVNGLSMQKLMSSGIDTIAAMNMFERWYNKLVPLNKGGMHQAKIIPLGHNYCQFDKGMIEAWLAIGGYEYNDFFHWHPRDTQVTGAYINDRHETRGLEPPFRELNLNYLCNKFGIDNENAHDALSDCAVTAKIYKHMCRMKENSFGAL